jgi:CRP-like cAMP-binding protein
VERFHRYYALHQLLKGRRVPVARAVIQQKLECSRATVSRIIEDLRNLRRANRISA